ncbi:hypothetical protein HK101_009943 [Irineochytrium annulatum]|nr:hypothetical protein HK101_009943 [Irineochytrium annulatum]
MLYDEKDLLKSYERIETIDFHQEMDVDGVKFTPYHAGHVLGASMFLIEIAGVRVLYTGDYSREEDRHLMAAEKPPGGIVPEVLITESTYGVQHHRPRVERERIFTTTVHDVVQRGGRCLIPVFALGRAQELLLILDEYWQAHPELHNVPIYYVSSLAKKCMAVYQTFSNQMNARIRQQSRISNPFQFKHISNLKSIGHFDDVGPCVMMASPGMLQSGLSRELLELWCTDKRNGVIIPGYVVEGTPAKQILSQPEEIISMAGTKLPLKLLVEYISFSAHVDFKQNSEFIEEVGSPNLILVHGDSNEMGRLKSALAAKYSDREEQLHIFTPKNCETIELYFRGEKVAKVIGSLAAVNPTPGQPLTALLVSRDYTYRLLHPTDLPTYTDLQTTTLRTRLVLPFSAPFALLRFHVESMFGRVAEDPEEVDDDVDTAETAKGAPVGAEPGWTVCGVVHVSPRGGDRVVVEWEGNVLNDMIADAVCALVGCCGWSGASVRATGGKHSHDHGHEHVDKKVKVEEIGESMVGVEEVGGKDETDGGVKVKVEDVEGDTKMEEKEDIKPWETGLGRMVLVKTEKDDPMGGPGLPEEDEVEVRRLETIVTKFLNGRFGEKCVTYEGLSEEGRSWKVEVDLESAVLVLGRKGMRVDGEHEDLKRRLTSVVARLQQTLQPISSTWSISTSFGE